MFQPDPALSVTAFPPRPREAAYRRVLHAVGGWYQWGEVLLDRLVSQRLNPLYHTGTIAVFSLAVATVTGIYLFLFYRVGTTAAHQSIEGIMAQPLGIGALMRSLHRYSSDAAILAAGLHGLKMFLNDRFWGPRWIGWVTGLALVALVWITGATGYWLVWDAQALVLSITTAQFLDVTPFFTEPIVQTFVRNDTIQSFLFFIVLFIHITIPLLLGATYWLHVMRLARARFFPPRIVLWVTGLALVVASLLRPALSGPAADPSVLPGVVPVDWFYFPYFPLTRLDPSTGWAIVTGATVLIAAVPWLLRGRPVARATVENVACTGCTRCYKDCPYDAIMMMPRKEGGRYKTEAVVNPARCVGCGICVGACDTAGILLGGEHARVLVGGVTGRVVAVRNALAQVGGPTVRPVVVFACRLMPRLEPRLDPDGMLSDIPGATVVGLPCVGMLHPEMIESALASGADGVYVAGCVPEDCQAREGSDLLAQRLAGERQPKLKAATSGRVRLDWYSPVEVRRLLAELRGFLRSLS